MKELETRFGGTTTEFRGETTVRIPREKILEACRYLKQAGFDMLTDVSGVDNFGDEVRYEVVYHLYSINDRRHLRLKASVPEDDLIVDSVVEIWKTADWHEREAFDMFGIRFRNHPNLKRILMWDDYPYFPLRKDFPLAGIPTELPETATDADSVRAAPMLGGPFFGGTGTNSSRRREPRQYDTPAEQQEHLQK
jgi:NADH-quinone oxidoreductase subunit C